MVNRNLSLRYHSPRARLLVCLALLSVSLFALTKASAQRGQAAQSPLNFAERTSTQADAPDVPSPIRPGEFVSVTNGKLRLGDREFRFAGNNAYFLQPEIAYDNLAGVRETLDKTVALGLSVVRTIGFNDHPSKAENTRCPGLSTVPVGNDTATIQFAPGVFCEANLRALDQAVAEAKARNVRLIVYLTNNFTAYGGIRRYVYWFLNREPMTPQEVQLFYTNETIKTWFKNYVRMLLERTNTVTGVRYKDEPAILAWELGNELRNDSGNPQQPFDATVLLNWIKELTDFIKGLDRNHLVGDGGEGFDNQPGEYPGLSNPYAVRGDTGNSFSRLVRATNLDLVSYHLYPMKWGLNDRQDAESWIREHERLARAGNKAAYLGEYGQRPSNNDPPDCNRALGRAFDPQRAQTYDRWLDWVTCRYSPGICSGNWFTTRALTVTASQSIAPKIRRPARQCRNMQG